MKLHWGNENFVDLQNQDENECVYCAVDLHAITVKQDSKTLKKILEKPLLPLASGLNHKVLFNQSLVPVHAEGSWMLGCIAEWPQIE